MAAKLNLHFFFFYIPFILFAQSQDIKFERISVEHGLSQSSVHCIFQDSQGFMWFGTEDGLNKYDGYKFTIYNYDQDNAKSLSSNEVWSIYEDKSGVLWIGTFGGGINKFDRDTEQFTRYEHDSNDPNSISNNRVMSIYEDKSGVLWIGTEKGLNKFDNDSISFTHYLPEKSVSSIDEDKSGMLLIGTIGDGFIKYDKVKQEFIVYSYDSNDPNSLRDNQVWSLLEDRSGILWIGTYKGLDKFDPINDQFIHLLPNEYIVSIYEDKSGILWIGSRGGGLKRFDRKTEQFTHFGYE